VSNPFFRHHPLLENSPALMAAYAIIETELNHKAALLLHGSLTIGVDDPHADIDLWVLSDDASVEAFDRSVGTRFIEFNSPRKGHFQIESVEAFQRRMSACDFELISELRHAQVIRDYENMGQWLIDEARKPMDDDVRFAWFRYHYVEMRGEHRACDNSVERSNAPALLMCVGRTIQHAMQAAMILDREPYRYSKWLTRMAERAGPTGARIVPLVNDAVWLISAGALLDPGPEREHRLSLKLREIRTALIDAARAGGIDEPWLTDWYLHIDKARRGVHDVRW
jgi:hypothetical protein